MEGTVYSLEDDLVVIGSGEDFKQAAKAETEAEAAR